uniref:histidine kinase n=1 Tax=Candidatus Kentrum sp. LFY TaxID=2126342 RepID=A0A450W9Y2_9GAMM|nr:MAG: Tetratricopeptide repeat-containing protein [Candidatus Kentron sp. LFY]
MPKKSKGNFSNFQDLGKHLGRKPPSSSRHSPDTRRAFAPKRSTNPKEEFEREKKYLEAQLLRARGDHNRRSEGIQLNKLGTLYRKNGDFDQAIVHYQKALELDKEDPFALDGLGMAYFKMGDYDQAITWFDKQLNPVVAMTNLCRAHRYKDDYQEAIRFAQRVLDKDPENVIAMNELGILYRLLREYDESIAWFERCRELRPRDKQPLDGLGITCREMGDYEASVRWFQKRLDVDPNDKQALDGIGITCREMGDYEASVRWFQKKLDHYPNNKEALDGLGITCREMGDHEASVRWFQEKLDHYPNNKQALDGLGITCREMGDHEASVRWFQKLLDVDPNNKHALDGLGITCREMGDYEESVRWFQKRLDVDPNNKHALDGLGITCLEKGDYEQAIAWFEKLSKVEPNSSYARRGLITTYRSMGTSAQAVQLLKQYLRTAPEDRDARSQLTAISEEYEKQGETQAAKEIVDFLRESRLVTSGMASPKDRREQETLDQRAARLERKTERQQRLLQRFQRLGGLGVMVSTMAHEIKQPLQRILSISQNCRRDVARKKPEASFVLDDLAGIGAMARRIDDIVTHLRDLSRGHETRRGAVAVDEALEGALQLFGEQFKARGIQVWREFVPDLPPVFADRTQLEQAFINLIVNARDAMEKQPEKHLTVRTTIGNDQVEIGFIDTGCGIPAEKLADIFDPFFTTKGDDGTGLGLYIVQETIRSLGGDIRVDSTPGQGTEFMIDLPVMGQGGASDE